MGRALMVGTDAQLQSALAGELQRAGHEVLIADRPGEVLQLARSHRPDLVIVEKERSDSEGTAICRALRWDDATRDVSVMVLAPAGDEIDRIVSLELGVDDYVTRPFNIREVVLRVRAILRRGQRSSTPMESSVEELADLRIERESHRVWVARTEVRLSVLELKILLYLVDRRGEVVARQSLVQAVWGNEDQFGEGSRALDTTVKRLRSKLGAGARYLQTVRGFGYRLTLDGA